jgi:polar amino acid transport system substrate-binding protein
MSQIQGAHMRRTVSFSRRAGIALLFPAALLAACGGSTNGGGSSTPTPSAAAGPEMQPTIAAEVPAAIKADAPLQIATDASYAPNEFVDLNGNLVGWDIDLSKDVCKVLGIACTINNVTFSDIIPALLENPSKYQMSFSSYTPTTTREAKGIDFITYYQAGEAWLVKTGGATISQASDMCGHTVAVEAGTTEELDAWGYMGMNPGGSAITPVIPDNCKTAGKPDITVDSFDTQTEANAALLSGRADFGWADQPVADYQVKLEAGKLKIGGSACSVYPYGVAIVKTLGLDQAVQDAIKYLIDNNFYTQILTTWGVQDGAIASSAVTVNDNNPVGSTCVPAY